MLSFVNFGVNKKCLKKCDSSFELIKKMRKVVWGKKRLLNNLDIKELFELLLKIFKRSELNGYEESDKVKEVN